MTYQRPESDRDYYPEAYLRASIIGMLGGRAAEEIAFGTKAIKPKVVSSKRPESHAAW